MSDTAESPPADSNAPRNVPAPTLPPDPQPREDRDRPMTADEELDEALDETFPASDPIASGRIDGPGN